MRQDICKYIQLCMERRKNITQAELARRMYESPQWLNNKFKRNSFNVDDLERIANALNAELRISFVDKTTGKPII